MLYSLLIAVTGLALGMRYKVLVLIPMTALVLCVTIMYGLVQHAGVTPTVVALVAAVLALQVGYCCGAALVFARAKLRPRVSPQDLRTKERDPIRAVRAH